MRLIARTLLACYTSPSTSYPLGPSYKSAFTNSADAEGAPMPNVISQLANQFAKPSLPEALQVAGQTLLGLLDSDAYVGEVVSLGYSEAIVQIHDFIVR